MNEKDSEKCPDVSDLEKEIAQNALADFKKKNFNICLQQIGRLLEVRNDDFKVFHNKAVIEFCKSDFRKTEPFQKNLISICSQFRLKAESLDDVDYCILFFNQAIVLYHQKQFSAAQKIMDRVYKFIEPMDDFLVKQVSLLATELQLCIRQPDKALTLISYLENNLMYGGSIPLKGFDKTGKEKKFQLPPPKPLPQDFERKLLKYKLRSYIMNHSLNIASKEIQVLLKDKSNIDAIFQSANIEYLKGNFKKSLELLSSICENCYTYNDYGENSSVMINNNIGVIHHAMGKPNLACHYFQTALKEDIGSLPSDGKKVLEERPLHTLGGSKYHELMYNLGISLLHAGRAAQAFDCFIVAVRRYHRNSSLWMRLAECCIVVHKKTNEIDFEAKKKLIVDVVGTKENQKIVLANCLSTDKKYSTESQSYAVPVPSLEFASLCLRNAKLLIPSDTAAPPVPLFLIPGVTPPVPPPSPSLSPSNPLSKDGIANLRNCILAASTYVSLCLGDYIIALDNARELLEQPKISGIHNVLAHLYAAECLVLLDKISEAIDHLNPENIIDMSFCLSDVDKKECCVKTNPPPKWFPQNIQSVHAVLQYNIAVAKTIRGQFEQASTIVKQVWQQRSKTCLVPAQIVMLLIYIELQLGHTEVAKNLIRQYMYHNRLTG